MNLNEMNHKKYAIIKTTHLYYGMVENSLLFNKDQLLLMKL